MSKKKELYIAVLFLISTNIVNVAIAEEPIIISLDCLESCKGQTLNYSNNILLELTIKNNLGYWAKIWGGRDGSNLLMNIYNDKLPNGKESENPFGFFAQSIFIKPKEELKVYIPFKSYNDKNKDDRIGDWRISPRFIFSDIQFYRNPSDLNNINGAPKVNSPITGNDLQFEIEKPITNVQVDKSSVVSEGWDKTINFIVSNLWSIFIMVIGGIIVSFITYKYILPHINARDRKKE